MVCKMMEYVWECTEPTRLVACSMKNGSYEAPGYSNLNKDLWYLRCFSKEGLHQARKVSVMRSASEKRATDEDSQQSPPRPRTTKQEVSECVALAG